MKRFIVFAGSTYYPTGGWGDMKSSFDTFEEANDLVSSVDNYDWFEIVDITTGKVVSTEFE